MNEDTIKGNWNELKGKVKEQWGRLTDDEIEQIDGKSDQLVGAIQKHYGRSVDEAKREIDEWRSGVKH
ncbi:CsbD family protein [Woeseia oceani]|uniref:CsbD-like domain-containing protein n=1 Tax=Woeseia oceani TaxID=1548547 RepID=A0A193LJY1_9GAMM|nr:CsbD family protein [Woeseia oceani]ANO52709.1 hypothetical protein BA177_17270 [Woeseia oceani]